MKTRRALEVVAVGLLLAVVVGQALGQPLLLGYVASGSMAPTLERGDGFVAVPAVLAGQPEVGDVVVYRARHIQGGGLVTHRVVGRTDAGYITRGDANPFTDQAGGERPVPPERVVAVALAVDGEVLAIPGVGTVAMAARSAVERLGGALGDSNPAAGLGLVIFGLGLLLVAFRRPAARRRQRSRSRSRAGDVLSADRVALVLALLVVAPAVASMVGPAGPHSLAVVSSQTDAPRADVVTAGTTATRTLAIRNGGVLPVVSYLEAGDRGVEVARERHVVPPGERGRATVAVAAPAEIGYYVHTVREHRYLLVLPLPVVDALYRVHPVLPTVATAGALGAAVVLAVRLAIGRAGVRLRSRARRRARQ